MLPGFAAAELDDGAQGVDDEFVDPVELLRLLVEGFHLFEHQRLQIALVEVQLDGVGDAALDDIRIERLVDDVRHPEFVPLEQSVVGVLGRDQDHRDAFPPLTKRHVPEHLEPVHDRHDHVQQHDEHLFMIRLQQFQSLKAVLRLQNLVGIVEQLGEDRPVQLDIVNDENLSLFH